MSNRTFYRFVKRLFDIAVSLTALVILLPALLMVALAIKIETPGPVLFIQRRVGKHKKIFNIYKFRSMSSDAPANVPTHLLSRPEAHITKVGRVLRKTSIDELPQLFNVLKGDMSFVGPRPALWNQFDLVAERDRYGANDVLPGITGWAQVNGRDELSILQKALLDGEYVKEESILLDARCLILTFVNVLSKKGVVEGSTRSRM